MKSQSKAIVLILVLVASLMLPIILPATKAQASGVPIDKANFPDAIFREFVKQYDTNGDQILQESELNVATQIHCRNYGISSLTGIKHFTNLVSLDCAQNHLTTLDVSTFKNLEELYCGDNQLTELDLSGLKKLVDVECTWNKLTDLKVANLANLIWFYCYNNRLTELNLSGLTSLKYFDCGNNQLTELDVTDLVKVEQFDCYGNHLSSLDVSACKSLWHLHTRWQQLGELQTVENGGQSVLNLGDLVGVDVSKIKSVTQKYGENLPPDYKYDTDSGILTINAGAKPLELLYLYDTNANRAKLDIPPKGVSEEEAASRGNSTPDMEVFFTVKLKAEPPQTTAPEQRDMEIEIPETLNEGNDVDALGNSVVYYQGKSTGAAFKVPGAELDDFKSVKINDEELSATNYTVEAGSIIVKLKQEYLKTLSSGNYKVEIVTRKGSGIKTLKVELSAETTDPATPATGETPAPTTPVAGEAQHTKSFVWFVLLLLVGAALLLIFFLRKRVSRR
ncbi:MAG TPA: leucine-rich repeat domain-containing protein [Bacillota bacterium]|jgi:hypothetical protein|nr:leucine-rich repeat domain-containing protein [Bacillota bacterium]HQC48936.1 leucine-rich repeat domain-containing protein [Bacillota bacterium]